MSRWCIAIVLVGCAADSTSTQPRDCGELPRAASLEVDGVVLDPLTVLATDAITMPAPADHASIEVAHTEPQTGYAYGVETDVFVGLPGLTIGDSATATATVSYRLYPAANEGRSPSETDAPAIQSGRLDVYSLATEPGETTCGTFDLTAIGTKHIHVTGWFAHPLQAPQPGAL